MPDSLKKFGKNLKHLKHVTMLYVAIKSATSTPEEIHKVFHMLQDSLDEKFTFMVWS